MKYPLGVRLTVGGILLLTASLILGRLAHHAPSEMAIWLSRLNWTFFIIGGGCVFYGTARIFTVDR